MPSNDLPGNDSTKRTVTYILSHSYSGSTLLTYLLANNPDISTIGELKATRMGDIASYICSCGEKIVECDFWGQLQDKMKNEGRKFSLESFSTQFESDKWLCNKLLKSSVRSWGYEKLRSVLFALFQPCRKQRDTILEQCDSLVEFICALQEGNILLDGSKDAIRLLHYVNSGRFNVKVIYLVKDGRGVVNSYVKHRHSSLDKAVQDWIIAQKELDRTYGMINDSNKMLVRYETLCKNPDIELARINDFLGAGGVSDTRLNKSRQHILGNKMRLVSSDEIRMDEKWKSEMSKDDLDYFMRHAGKYNSRIGFD